MLKNRQNVRLIQKKAYPTSIELQENDPRRYIPTTTCVPTTNNHTWCELILTIAVINSFTNIIAYSRSVVINSIILSQLKIVLWYKKSCLNLNKYWVPPYHLHFVLLNIDFRHKWRPFCVLSGRKYLKQSSSNKWTSWLKNVGNMRGDAF